MNRKPETTVASMTNRQPETTVAPVTDCYELERQREIAWRQTSQGAFESSMVSLDRLNDSFDDPTKIYAFSDNGAGAWAIRHYPELKNSLAECHRKIDAARKKLVRLGHSELLPVFYLVLKNGTDWKKSVCELIERSKRRRRARTARQARKATSKAPNGTSPISSTLDT